MGDMHIQTLELNTFRSYDKNTFHFSSTVTLIVGANTAGKTNILEAIHCLSLGKSFRAEKESDMVSWGQEVSHVLSTVYNDKHEETPLELVITTGQVHGEKAPAKKYIVNGIPRRLVDFVGNIRSVLFSPEDLELVTDSPHERRAYLNTVLVQADSEYRRNLQSFERGLRQRNKLLDLIHDGRASRSQLIFWDQLLISTGSFITEKRQMYIEYVNKIVLDNFHYKLMYDKSIISESRLLQYKDEEVAAKTTLVGPQRDDFTILKPTSSDFLNRKTPTDPLEEQDPYHDVARFGSRGEQRLAVLWLKLAELSFIQQETGERPILLLDDIFSELDEKSRDIVLSIIYKQQTVITSAEEDVKELFGNDKDVGVITLPMQ